MKTNASGNFAFLRVPPVKGKLQADLSVWRDYPITSSLSAPMDLRPGEDLTVDLGAGGRRRSRAGSS